MGTNEKSETTSQLLKLLYFTGAKIEGLPGSTTGCYPGHGGQQWKATASADKCRPLKYFMVDILWPNSDLNGGMGCSGKSEWWAERG